MISFILWTLYRIESTNKFKVFPVEAPKKVECLGDEPMPTASTTTSWCDQRKAKTSPNNSGCWRLLCKTVQRLQRLDFTVRTSGTLRKPRS